MWCKSVMLKLIVLMEDALLAMWHSKHFPNCIGQRYVSSQAVLDSSHKEYKGSGTFVYRTLTCARHSSWAPIRLQDSSLTMNIKCSGSIWSIFDKMLHNMVGNGEVL